MQKEEKVPGPVSLSEFAPTTYSQWKEEAVASLKGGVFEKKLLTQTLEDITLQPIYTKDDLKALGIEQAYPGERDFLRGEYAAGYLSRPWAIAQSVSEVCPKTAGERVTEELGAGGNAVYLRLSTDTKMGEHSKSADGVCLQDASDVRAVFASHKAVSAQLHIPCGPSAIPMLGALNASGRQLGSLKGCVGADPLGDLAVYGKLPCTLERLYGEMADAALFAATRLPYLRAVLVDAGVYAAGGANAVQEVACALATAADYLAAMIERGMTPGQAIGSLRVQFALGSDFFMEIAKLRAARIVFARMAEVYGAPDTTLEIFCETSPLTKTVYDPYVNLLRATTEAFSAVVGGADAISVSPLDQAGGGKDDTARRVARNIQVLLREEFGLTQPVDPAGGSYYVETLTRQLAEKAWAYFQKIEEKGGMAEALATSWIQSEIAGTMEKRFKKLATRQERAVGINMYVNQREKPFEEQIIKETAPAAKAPVETSELLETLNALASAHKERVLLAAAAFNAGASFSQVRDALGRESEIEVIPIAPHRRTERFEALRQATEKYEKRTGKTAKVFLACMGPVAQHKARADFSEGFFGPAKFDMVRSDGFGSWEEAAKAAAASGAIATVICSTDETYPEIVPPLARAIKKQAPGMTVILAGAPVPEMKDEYEKSGVDIYIHLRANCYEILHDMQQERGIF